MTARARIEMLGGLRVVGPDGVITRFPSQKTGALLAYLAYHVHRQHPRETLIELLWPEGNLEAGRLSLRVTLSALRIQLEPTGIGLLANRNEVGLDPTTVTTDAAEFEAALVTADSAPGDAERELWLA